MSVSLEVDGVKWSQMASLFGDDTVLLAGGEKKLQRVREMSFIV